MPKKWSTDIFTPYVGGGIGVAFTEIDLFVEGRYAKIFDFETPRFAPNGNLTGVIEDDVDTFGANVGVGVNF